MAQQFIIKYLLLSISILFIVSIFNFIVDPLEQYREAKFYKQAYNIARHQIPGIAKNYDYKTIIIGTSLTENTNIDDVAKILGYTQGVKFTMGGSSANEQKLALDVAFRHKKIDTVLYGLDTTSFSGDIDDQWGGKRSLPEYLYNESILDDYKYILSMDTLKKSVKGLTKGLLFYNKFDPKFNYNKMFQWECDHSEKEYNYQAVVEGYHNGLALKSRLEWQKSHRFEKLKASFDYNLYLLIKSHPETKFVIFYPPRPVVRYKTMSEFGVLADEIMFKRYIFNRIGKLDNVEIYDFNIAYEVTHNLSLYRDSSHYHPKINKWILEQIHNKNTIYKVRIDNIEKNLIYWKNDSINYMVHQ